MMPKSVSGSRTRLLAYVAMVGAFITIGPLAAIGPFATIWPGASLVSAQDDLDASGDGLNSRQATTVPENAGQKFQESLESMGSVPWYDAERGSVEPIPVKPRMDDSTNRDSRWIPKPKKEKATSNKATNPQQPTNPNGQLPGFWSALGTFFGEFSQVIGWLILGLLFAAIVGGLVYAFSKMEIDNVDTGNRRIALDQQLDEADEVRLENLPVQVQRPTGDLLSESDRLRAAGRLSEAIIYLFGHRLLQLDRVHAIRLSRGKTNRQYLLELRRRVDLEGMLRSTVNLFEQSYFGRYEITPEQYDYVRRLQPEFESALAVHREAA